MSVETSLEKLQKRLAPDNATMQIVKANRTQHTGGQIIQSLSLRGPFNTLVNNLSSGIVNVFFGSGTGGQPELVLHPTDNPLTIPLGFRTDPVVTFIVASNSDPAQGSIFLEFY